MSTGVVYRLRYPDGVFRSCEFKVYSIRSAWIYSTKRKETFIKFTTSWISMTELHDLKCYYDQNFAFPFLFQLCKVKGVNTSRIPTGRPVISNVKFSFGLPPLIDSKDDGQERLDGVI